METGDADAHTHKRPRLDSVNPNPNPNPAYNAHPPPPLPPHAQPSRHPSHPNPPHSLPPPSPAYPGPQAVASPSLPRSDIRAYSDPRNIPSPGQRTHGLPIAPVNFTARNISQDSIATYRPPLTPQSSSAPDHHPSRSNSIDAKPTHMENGAHPHWTSNPDHRHAASHPAAMGYPAPPPPPQAQGAPNGSPSHEQPFTPPLQPQHYGQPVSVYPPTPYMTQQYATQQAQMRRKQVRATQACNNCRSRKQKCDEARPCQFCRENNFDCQYKDVPPPKQDRSMMQLQDSVNNMSDTLKSFLDKFETWKYHVDNRLAQHRPGDMMNMPSNHPSPDQGFPIRGSMSEHSGSRMPTPVQGRTQMHRVNSMKNESPIVAHSNLSPVAAYASTPVKQEVMLGPPHQPATPADSVRTDHTHSVGDSKKDDSKKGLQGDHTTAAHQLLEEWRLLENMCQNMDSIKMIKELGLGISDYPMFLEQKRGLVRVWGIGEGSDLNDGTQGPVSPESYDSDPSSPRNLQEGLWGTGDHSSPSTMGGETPRDPSFEHPGGLDEKGELNLKRHVIKDLHDAYHNNIHSLHPFINPSSLRKMIHEFSDKYSPEKKAGSVMSPGTAIPNHLNPSVKRKRSSSSFTDPYSPARDRSTISIEKSLRNAIVLLVLALGKVCLHDGPLPAPINDRGPVTVERFGYVRDPLHARENGYNEEQDRPKNIDLMPGMAYFSYATDILGNQQGGNTVAHAQCMLLAALYLGQFARVLESWSWINNACRICLILIKSDMPKIERTALLDQSKAPVQYLPKENYRLNLVKCVYWTCLQLETDILAELSSLPPSDISKYQATVSYPSGVFEKFPDGVTYDESSAHEQTMWIYSSQIHLRVILNEAHNTLYSPEDKKRFPNFDSRDAREVVRAARLHSDILMSWRRLLPATLAWGDDEPPASDINIARLRAKFYGGHYMILRPFLYLAVHHLPGNGHVNGNEQHWARQIMNPATESMSPDRAEILKVAQECISSAIQSTIAFDRVGHNAGHKPYVPYVDLSPKRLIVTNIFGTLHAQFGNMLVLAAVFKSALWHMLPQEHRLSKANLSKLYNRTIRALGQVAPNSPVLNMDRDILMHIQRELDLDLN